VDDPAHAPGRADLRPDGCRRRAADGLSVQCFRWCPVGVHLRKIAGPGAPTPPGSRRPNAFGGHDNLLAPPNRLPASAQLALSGGLLALTPCTGDPWGSCLARPCKGPLLQQRHGNRLALRAFITEFFPRYGLPPLELTSWLRCSRAIADGDLSRPIRHLPPRGQIAADLQAFPAYFVLSPPRTCSPPCQLFGEAAMPDSRKRGHFYRASGQPALRDSAASATGSRPSAVAAAPLGVQWPVHRRATASGILDDPQQSPAGCWFPCRGARAPDGVAAGCLVHTAEPGNRSRPVMVPASRQPSRPDSWLLTRWEHEDRGGLAPA